MFRKIFAIFLLLALMVSFVPQEAFCGDHVDSEPVHHDCTFTCHACFHVVASEVVVPKEVFQVSDFKVRYEFSYQDPIITRLKRPPIQIS